MVSSWRLRFGLNHLEVWSQCQVYPLRFWQRLTCSSRVHKKCTCWGHGEREAGLEPDFGRSPMIFWTLGSLLAHWSPSRIEARATSIQVRHSPPSHTKSRGPEPQGRTRQSIYSTTSTTKKKRLSFGVDWNILKLFCASVSTPIPLPDHVTLDGTKTTPGLHELCSWRVLSVPFDRIQTLLPEPKHISPAPNMVKLLLAKLPISYLWRLRVQYFSCKWSPDCHNLRCKTR